jgi:hypothetical protein
MKDRTTYEVTIRHPNGDQRVVQFEAPTDARLAHIKAKGLDRLWAERVILDSIRTTEVV